MSSSSRNGSSSSWTPRQDKRFEDALALHDEDTPNRWQKVAKAVGGKTPEEVQRHYSILVRDLKRIESGQIPFPNYRDGNKLNLCNICWTRKHTRGRGGRGRRLMCCELTNRGKYYKNPVFVEESK